MTLIDGRGIRKGTWVSPVTDVRNPQAVGVCDGCGFWTQHVRLKRQMEYRGGATPVWNGFLVCDRCYDVPNPFYAKQVLPPDPVPVVNPRPEQRTNSGFGYLVTDGTGNPNYIVTGPDIWVDGWLVTEPNYFPG